MNPELKKALEALSGEYEAGKNELLGLVKSQQEEIDKFGGVKEETKNAIAGIETKFETVEGHISDIQEKMKELEAEAGRGFLPGGEDAKSIGSRFVESEAYEQYKSKRFHGDSGPMEVGNLFSDLKALSSDRTGGLGNLGNWIQRQELPDLEPVRPPLTIRDLLPVIPTVSDTVHYMEYLGFANIFTALTANLLATATVLPVVFTGGMFQGQKLQLMKADGSGNQVEVTVLTVDSATQVTITAAVGTAFSAGDHVTSRAIGMTAHGQQKPEASMKITERSHPVGTMAHYMVAHRQTLADIPQLRGLIDNELLFGLRQSEEEQVLYGNGISPNLQGIMNNVNIQSHGTYTGTKDTGGVWRYKHIRQALTKTQISGFPPSAGIVHPNDWEAIELAQDTTNRFIYGTIGDGAQERVWRTRVLVTMAIRPLEFLFGAFNLGAYLLDREDANVRFSDSHKDFFTSNQVAVLAEERLGMAVRRPQAFTKGSFA
ncbi:phage major capsid protein [uncultured Arthrobacter sp.]|uniref:phage major capsid protein n=1 Tax=uncultured Arthrobacter sp. TaxID=114050 RepID=UPI0025F2C0D6|nr:phage major capsid protein [uncultured Arthrobacter sp.]